MSDSSTSPRDGGAWGAVSSSATDHDAVAEPVATAPEADAAVAAPVGGMSPNAKRGLIAAAVTAGLVLVVGVTVFAVLLAFGLPGSKPASQPAAPASAAANIGPGGQPTTTSAVPVPKASAPAIVQVANSDVYTTKDPFQPLIAPVTPPAATATATASTTKASTTTSTSASASKASSSTPAPTSTDASGTLSLQAIVTQHGVRKAKLSLDGATYTLAAGQRIGKTSWEVFDVGVDYVVMLYGDEKITLTLGQGVSQ